MCVQQSTPQRRRKNAPRLFSSPMAGWFLRLKQAGDGSTRVRSQRSSMLSGDVGFFVPLEAWHRGSERGRRGGGRAVRVLSTLYEKQQGKKGDMFLSRLLCLHATPYIVLEHTAMPRKCGGAQLLCMNTGLEGTVVCCTTIAWTSDVLSCHYRCTSLHLLLWDFF